MTKLEFCVPESMLASTPLEGNKIILIGFLNRKVDKAERPRCVWFECRSRGYGSRLWVDGKILFHSTREDMLEDALVLVQEILRDNPQIGIQSVWVGARHARIDQAYFLRSCLRIREDRHYSYHGGRRILQIRNPRKAFGLLDEVRREARAQHKQKGD